jgi:hypothetical protein
MADEQAANGISGGCQVSSLVWKRRQADRQDLYNVYASPNYSDAYATAESTCRGDVQGSWVPTPERTLAVDVFGENGVVAERAWPASCTSSPSPPYTQANEQAPI